MTLLLVRHPRVAAPSGLCYGRTDVPLAATFTAELAMVRKRLRIAPPVVFTSPAGRCRRLAEALGAAEVRVDERLQELDFGDWENRRWDDLPRHKIDAWARDFVDRGPPGGESFRALAGRVDAFRREHGKGGAVVVTHAGVIRAWLCLACGTPLADAFHHRVAYGECIAVPSRGHVETAGCPPAGDIRGLESACERVASSE